ncbi:formylmethanofuran dehydrogenase subunit E family protein [uncultured Mailhella sp.]|uniref:formylmethanofuran dehydrogenase subunit E family protein n=1 Tax=uncultured Mailhella sp. TaxID=1981031 RepID=UPI0025D278E1|nr:formylmethanofuran dehydrogenase subunit E family protein [uncultured Mailhella sp.]
MIPFTSFDDFIEEARAFHGSASPGLIIGASMVELALHSMGRTQNYHALCETERDLPDAVQLLTPCTTGNGRLHVLSLGRFALTLFRRQNGKGVRVHLDLAKTAGWPHIRRWVLQRLEDGEREQVRLEHEIRKAGISILSASPVQMRAVFMDEALPGPMTACISCGEPHPASMGVLCRACAGQSPYVPHLPASPLHDGSRSDLL